MQESPIHAEVEYASVGWRAAALLVDMVVLFGLLIIVVLVWVTVLVAQGRVDPSDPTAAQALAQELTWTSGWAPNAVLWCALFIYYALLEGIFGASVGKLVFRMRVVMPDGSRATGLAVVVRNLVRIPEAWMLYIPAAVSCTMSAQRQRLGDHAARTVVVRQVTDGAIARHYTISEARELLSGFESPQFRILQEAGSDALPKVSPLLRRASPALAARVDAWVNAHFGWFLFWEARKPSA